MAARKAGVRQRQKHVPPPPSLKDDRRLYGLPCLRSWIGETEVGEWKDPSVSFDTIATTRHFSSGWLAAPERSFNLKSVGAGGSYRLSRRGTEAGDGIALLLLLLSCLSPKLCACSRSEVSPEKLLLCSGPPGQSSCRRSEGLCFSSIFFCLTGFGFF